jgi:hypothetical protein
MKLKNSVALQSTKYFEVFRRLDMHFIGGDYSATVGLPRVGSVRPALAPLDISAHLLLKDGRPSSLVIVSCRRLGSTLEQ